MGKKKKEEPKIMEGRSRNVKIQIIEIPQRHKIQKSRNNEITWIMEMNFSDLRKRKEHGVRKTMENQKKKRSKTLKKNCAPI